MKIAPESTNKKARRAQIAHCREQGLDATIVNRDTVREFHITMKPLPEEPIEKLVARFHAFVAAHQAQVLRQEVFGSISGYPALTRATAEFFPAGAWPLIWVEGKPCERTQLSGIHAFAVAGENVQSLGSKGRPAATIFNDGTARHILFGEILPSNLLASPGTQARQVFGNLAGYLHEAGMDLTDVARTWLYLDGILDWYDEFNVARRDVFMEHNVFGHCVPASTGIGARNPGGAALVAGAWAVKPLDETVTIRPVSSPLQCSAQDYGSCFSRAVEIASPDLRRLFISGTASIGPDGRTEHVGDIRKQVELTMEVVEAILARNNMRWADVTRATAYLKLAQDAWAFAEYCMEKKLNLPVLVTEADVCRDELLFELELDAMAPAASRSSGGQSMANAALAGLVPLTRK